MAALSPALDRGRHRVGAASGPAAALAPDRLTLGRAVGVCTPGPPAPVARATAAGAHAVARAGVTVARADTRAATRAGARANEIGRASCRERVEEPGGEGTGQ